MSDHILCGLGENDVLIKYPDISMGKIIFDSLKQRNIADVAVIDPETNDTVKFSEILTHSVQIANGLRNLGVNQNHVVAIVSENSTKYPVVLSACLYLGAAFNPVNYTYTTNELRKLLNVSKPMVLFTSEATLNSVLAIKDEVDYLEKIIVFGKSLNEQVLDYDELLSTSEANVDDFKIEEINNKDTVALILYSSGTTGLPKGVMLTHANLRIALTYTGDPLFCNISKLDTTICLLPFYHIFGMILSIGCLVFGMKLVLLSRFKPDNFLKCIQDYHVTKLFVVPTLALFMAKSPLVDNYNISSLNDLICASAPLGGEIQNILEKRLNILTRQGYGLTESSGLQTITPMGTTNKPGSSGKLVNQLLVKVVDLDTHEALGANKVGEICTKSEMLMKGYLGNEQATKDIYDEEGYLRTGDIGYYDEDGFFFIVDRLKELIKYKGFQVSPAELEDVLTSHKAVKEAAVIAKPDERAGELPMAFIVKEAGVDVSEQELVDYIAEHLSAQKHLYGGVRFTDSIPKTGSGKICRKSLREILKNELI